MWRTNILPVPISPSVSLFPPIYHISNEDDDNDATEAVDEEF